MLTAQEDGTDEWTDDDILDRATELGRVLFTEDADFLEIAAFRQGQGIFFAGICYLHQRDVQIGRCIAGLDFIAIVGTSNDLANRVQYLPFS